MGTERLRRLNTAAVLVALREHGPASRSLLAERTGLAKATIGAIVGHLFERGVVAEGAPENGARGRPSRPVSLAPSGLLGLGMEANVDYVAAALVDVAGGVVTSRTTAVGTGSPLEVLRGLAVSVQEEATGPVVGAGLAVPGLVDTDGRTVAWAPNLEWEDARPGRALSEALGLRVVVENDANLAAVAEGAHGAALDVRHSLYLTGTVGIGAGIVDDGRLVRGAGFAGEVGHMPIGRPDARCGCGRLGCWEATVGLRPMLRAVGEPEHANPTESATAVAARAEVEAPVRSALAELGSRLGHGIASLTSILDPDAVVLGGYFVPLAPWLLPVASAVIDERLPSADRHRPTLRAGALGIEAAAVGAAEHALTGVLDGSVPI
ncbi:ROK family protein [Aeromicrobium sp. CF4.19]|uniref:ROK family protein n=1 Tax=Aeromicrobium sp. CF4.19 TaxID=3373082 RepID=UPI003EE5D8CF